MEVLQGIRSLEALLAALEHFEEKIYGSLCPKAVPLSNVPLQEFILANSCIPREHIEPELYRVAPDLMMTAERLVQVMRENAMSEEAPIVLFWNLSGDGDAASADACRDSMLECVERCIGQRFGARGQIAIDWAMQGRAGELYMDEWLE